MKSTVSRSRQQTGPTSRVRVLVVDDHAQARQSMTDILTHAGHEVLSCASAVEAVGRIQREEFDVIITDLQMPGMNGLEFIRTLHGSGCGAQILMVTAHATVASAVEAMRYGALDYIEKPFDVDQLEGLVARAAKRAGAEQTNPSLPPSPSTRPPVLMVGQSAAMQALRLRLAQVAPTNETVLITGESGTGKELVARSLHTSSRRAGSAMIGLNCPALSEQLMESELFGHERGAFTSADAPRVGRFELADGGTILLDEVTEIALPLQAKLLRVLQERAFERVGSSVTQTVDVRVLATTNRDLREAVRQGQFREDLYYRLAVVPLHVPALRERREDISLLADHFLQLAARRLERDVRQLDPTSQEVLMEYNWPGNVRELENVMTRASVLGTGPAITADELYPWLLQAERDHATAGESYTGPDGLNLHQMERKLIEATLDHYGGHRARTAQALGIGVRTLCNKLRAYGYAPRSKTQPQDGSRP